MLAESLVVVEGICKLIDEEIAPRRDIRRALTTNDLTVIDTAELSQRQREIFDGLIFRDHELANWKTMSLTDKATVLVSALRRQSFIEGCGGQG